jgi:hypothetical protein
MKPEPAAPRVVLLDELVRDLRDHYNTDWDTTVPGEEFNAEIRRIVRRHLGTARAARERELRAALLEIMAEADQSNGGKGARLPIVLHIREIARAALSTCECEENDCSVCGPRMNGN